MARQPPVFPVSPATYDAMVREFLGKESPSSAYARQKMREARCEMFAETLWWRRCRVER
jgi:hypothetical protein